MVPSLQSVSFSKSQRAYGEDSEWVVRTDLISLATLPNLVIQYFRHFRSLLMVPADSIFFLSTQSFSAWNILMVHFFPLVLIFSGVFS